jgi:hypothetical protein
LWQLEAEHTVSFHKRSASAVRRTNSNLILEKDQIATGRNKSGHNGWRKIAPFVAPNHVRWCAKWPTTMSYDGRKATAAMEQQHVESREDICRYGGVRGRDTLAKGASAMPVADALAIRSAVPVGVETVQWRGWGWGLGAGFVAGAVVGSALARPYYYYGYDPYYYPGPYYAAPPGPVYGPPGPAYGPPVAGDPVAYCKQRYKSYDSATGTYLGFDGVRHPCP